VSGDQIPRFIEFTTNHVRPIRAGVEDSRHVLRPDADSGIRWIMYCPVLRGDVVTQSVSS
jgi:hypothetical protein